MFLKKENKCKFTPKEVAAQLSHRLVLMHALVLHVQRGHKTLSRP